MSTAPVANFERSWDWLQKAHPGRQVVVTCITLDKKQLPTETFGPGDKAKFLKWIAAAAAMPANCYFSVGEPLKAVTKKMERADIARVWYLHVDLDPRAGEDLAQEQERILNLLRNPPAPLPPPTGIVYSGGGYQGYWALSEPLTVDGLVNVAEELKLYNVQIERALGGDNCHDISRILRVPDTVNVPDEKKVKKGRVPALAQEVEWHADRVYPIAAFTKAVQVQTPGVASGAGIGDVPKIKAPGNVRQFGHVDEIGSGVSDQVKVYIVNGEDPSSPGHFPSRSEMLFWVTCEMVRGGVDDETIYAVLMNRDWKISDSILEKGGGAERYALRQIERAKEDAIDPALRELNDRHAVIRNFGGQCVVVEEVECPVLKRATLTKMGFDHFRNGYMNRWVNLGDKKDKKGNVVGTIEMPVGEWWLRNPRRRQYDRIVFAPGRDVPGAMNLWHGFAVMPKPGSWRLMRRHLLGVICSGNRQHYRYLIRWFARMVQQPGSQGEVAVVLRGPEGAGKSIVRKNIARMFGRHAMAVSQPSHLVGNFNYHLRDVVFLAAEEAFFAGDKRHQSVLKSIVTDESLTIERKGVDSETSPNFLHLMMLSNEQWVVPAGQDDRRYFVLDVSKAHMRDYPYFAALQAELDSGGLEAMLHDLLMMDLSDFNVRAKPDTDALRDQKKFGMKDEDKWVLLLLRDGLPESAVHEDFPDVAYPEDRKDGSEGLLSHARTSVPGLRTMSTVRLAEVAEEWGVTRKRYTKGMRYLFPPLSEMRAKFDAKWGKQEWPGGDEAKWGWTDEGEVEHKYPPGTNTNMPFEKELEE